MVAGPVLGTSPVMAAASLPAPNMVGASQMTPDKPPTGLRVAVRSALGPANGSIQQAELTVSDAAAGDGFGSVAISGSTAVVGATGKNLGKGAAYVFVRSGTAWTQQAELTASDGVANDSFGGGVAISGSTAVVGAGGKNLGKGAAYVFVHSGTAWTQQVELNASDSLFGFGAPVAISGSTVVVGAPTQPQWPSAAYVFVRSGTTWSRQAKLTVSGADGFFGDSVAISDSTVVVGDFSRGTAYVFVRSGTTWTLQATLTAGGGAYDLFSSSVAISGATAVIGAFHTNSNTGAAYVFVRSGTTWTQQAELAASDGAPDDDFGYQVAISDSTVAVGAFNKNSRKGAAYAFVRSGTTWSQPAELEASDGTGATANNAGDSFAMSLAISGSTVLAGAQGKNSNTGAAYVYLVRHQKPVTSTRCTVITALSAPPSPSVAGTAVAITGSATGCPHPLYQLWLLAPGPGMWQLAKPYSASRTFNWSTMGIIGGTYIVSVRARDASSVGVSSDSLGRWDAYNNSQYSLTPTPCTGIMALASPPSPSVAGTAVAIIGSASGCPNPLYQFWMLAPGSSTWQLVRAYTTNGIIMSWPTNGNAKGVYNFQIWVRDVSSAGTSGDILGRWDSYAPIKYSLI